MSKQQKPCEVYNKEMLIRQVARNLGRDISAVRQIYNEIDSVVFETLAKTSEEQDVQIRLMDGITIDSTFAPEAKKMNYLIGEMVKVSSRIKPKISMTRYYTEKLNKYYEAQKKADSKKHMKEYVEQIG